MFAGYGLDAASRRARFDRYSHMVVGGRLSNEMIFSLFSEHHAGRRGDTA